MGGNASGSLRYVTDTMIAKMGAMNFHPSVVLMPDLPDLTTSAVTVGMISSDVPMGNASRSLGNATETTTAEMGAMRQLRHVEPTARRWKGGLPALMGDASRPHTNATEAVQTAEMGAMKIHPSVAEDVPKTQQEAKQPPS